MDPTLTADALDKTIAEFDTVEDLLKHFNPESWQDDLENLYLDTPHYRGRSYHDRKSKGKNQSLGCSSSVRVFQIIIGICGVIYLILSTLASTVSPLSHLSVTEISN